MFHLTSIQAKSVAATMNGEGAGDFADRQGGGEAALQSLESQEVVVGDSGRTAIVVGDGHANEANDATAEAPFDEPTRPRSRGSCPGWLRNSSTALKTQIAVTTVALLVFLAVMIAGVLQLGGTGDKAPIESAHSESARAEPVSAGGAGAEPTTEEAAPSGVVLPPVPSPGSPAPQSSPSVTTDAPAEAGPSFLTIPVSDASITIGLPPYLEEMVPNFEDGLSLEEEDNWIALEPMMVDAITITLMQRLPGGFALDADSLQIETFDGYIVRAIRERRRRQSLRRLQGYFGLHDVKYSFAVTASCDDIVVCYVAPDVVEDITIEISGLDEVRIAADTPAPTEKITESPSSSPFFVTDAPASVSPTEQATLSPTLQPVTLSPVTQSPTGMEPLRDQIGGCNIYAQCERCIGGCQDGTECEEGLSCFLRRGFEAIPGCEGPGVRAQAYCYDPLYGGLAEESLLAVRELACDKKDRCGKCEGQCSQDEDCEKDLVCYRRFGLELVPGCASQGVLAISYCFDPDDYVAPF